MKKIVSIILTLVLACSFMFLGAPRAEAMNNESAAMLAGAIAIFGKPVLQTIVREITPPPAQAYTTTYSYQAYPARSEVVYVAPEHPDCYKPHNRAYMRGWRDERRRLEYERGRGDARRHYYDDHDDRYHWR